MEAAVVDVGSKLVKAGFAMPDQDPSMVISTAMMKMTEVDEKENIELDESVLMENAMNPMSRGMVKDWDLYEDLWHYILYSELGWEVGNEGQLLIGEPLLTTKISREKTVQLMFETFNVTGLFAAEQAVLSLYSVGRISGCVVDIGHGKTDIAPIWDGAVQHNAAKRLEIAGQDLTELLKLGLSKSNPHVNLSYPILESLKETYANTADDPISFSEMSASCPSETHILPDGQVVSIGREKYVLGEALFQPNLIFNVEEYGIVEQLVRCVSLCVPSENQKQMFENIVLCGGTSTIPGFDTRFQREVNLLATPSIRPVLVKPAEYMPENTLRFSAWMGGAILAKVVFPQNQHISKADYAESGPSIVHRKCY